MELKYNGIILSKFDVGEADRVYVVYTKEAGKIRALGKGVRRPNAKLAGQLEPLTYVEIFMAKSRGRGNITGAIAIENFMSIKSDISALQRIFYALGILEKIISDEEKDEKIFELLLGYLKTIEDVCQRRDEVVTVSRDAALLRLYEGRLDIITLGFLFKFLEILGYKIEVEKCVVCGEKLESENNFFSPELGGIICPSCGREIAKKIRISPNSIKLIRIFLKNKIENFSKIQAEKETIDNLKIIIREEIEWIK